MLFGEIIDKFEKFAPPGIAEEWDNVGLMVGDRTKNITKAFVCLDLTRESLDFAINEKCDLVVTHHPFIMGAIKSIDFSDEKSLLIRDVIKNDICVYSMHTNFDFTKGGINDYLCEMFGIVCDKADCENRIGKLINPLTLGEFAEEVKQKLNVKNILYCGDLNKKINVVGICSGSGGSLIEEFKNCDAYLTGEAKYHDFQKAKELSVSMVCAGHFETENPALCIIRKMLIDCNIDVCEKETYNGFYHIN